MTVLEVQAEQQLMEVIAQTPAISVPTTGTSVANATASAASAYVENVEQCMQEMNKAQEIILANLKKEGTLLQQRYKADQVEYRLQLKQAKNAEDDAWRMSLDRRLPDSGAQRRTEQQRMEDVQLLVQTHKTAYDKKAAEARKLADDANKCAQETAAKAQTLAGVAADARNKMEHLLQLEIQRRVEAQQPLDDAFVAHAEAQAL